MTHSSLSYLLRDIIYIIYIIYKYIYLSATILMDMGGYLGVYVILFIFLSMLKDHCGYTGKNE